jgi:deazaflavin-dependent oxidoreductase (nitroreductase family)
MVQTDFRTALKGTNELEITVTGRTSGRSLSYPVWFVLEGDKLSLLPARGSETDWYKNVRKTPTIRLEARGKTFSTSATPIADEAQVGEVVKKFRDKYGARTVNSLYPGSTWPSKSHSREVPARCWHARFTRVGNATSSERDVSHQMRAARALLGEAHPNPERLS